MLVTYYFIAAHAVIVIALFLWSFFWGDNASPRLWLLRLMLLGMCYDSSIKIMANLFQPNDWYLAMSYPHWILSLLVQPFLVVFSASIMVLAGIRVASKPLFINTLWLSVLVFIAMGCWIGIVYQQPQLVEKMGLQIYDNANISSLYSGYLANGMVTVIVMVIVALMSLSIWWVSSWPWLLVGVFFVFMVSAVGTGKEWGFLTDNLAQLLFMLSLLNTERHFFPRRF